MDVVVCYSNMFQVRSCALLGVHCDWVRGHSNQ